MIILGLTFIRREIALGYNFEQTADKNIVAMFVSSIVSFWGVFSLFLFGATKRFLMCLRE